MKEHKKIFDNWRLFLNEEAPLLPLDDPSSLPEDINPKTGEPWIRFDPMEQSNRYSDLDDMHPLDREDYWASLAEEEEEGVPYGQTNVFQLHYTQLANEAKKEGERWLEENPFENQSLSILDTASFGPLLDPRYKEQRLYYTPTEFTESLTRNLNESSMPGYFIEEIIEEELEKIFREVKSKIGHAPRKKHINIKIKGKPMPFIEEPSHARSGYEKFVNWFKNLPVKGGKNRSINWKLDF